MPPFFLLRGRLTPGPAWSVAQATVALLGLAQQPLNSRSSLWASTNRGQPKRAFPLFFLPFLFSFVLIPFLLVFNLLEVKTTWALVIYEYGAGKSTEQHGHLCFMFW